MAVNFTDVWLFRFPEGLQPSQLLRNSDGTSYAQHNDAVNRPVLLSFGEVKAVKVPASPSFLHDSKFPYQFDF